MASRKSALIGLVVIITALFFYQWRLYHIQYQRILESFEEYQTLINQERDIVDEWQDKKAKKKTNFKDIERKSRNLNFRLYDLKAKVESTPVNNRYKGISEGKEKLSASIDDTIKRLVLLSTLNSAEIKGDLNRVEQRDYYQLFAENSALEDRGIDVMFASRPVPDFYNSFNRLKGLRRYFNNYP